MHMALVAAEAAAEPPTMEVLKTLLRRYLTPKKALVSAVRACRSFVVVVLGGVSVEGGGPCLRGGRAKGMVGASRSRLPGSS